jgi:uncharacterized protein
MNGPAPSATPSARLQPVSLRDRRLREEGRDWRVEQPIRGLETLTPVRGTLRLRHHGRALEVEVRAAAIVTLCCDRCLQHYNHPLEIHERELIELSSEEDASLDPVEGPTPLDERLDPEGCFDPERWLFEQLSLALPLVNRCGADCPGPDRWSSEDRQEDPRWAALRTLRVH